MAPAMILRDETGKIYDLKMLEAEVKERKRHLKELRALA